MNTNISSRYALAATTLAHNETAIADSGCTSHFLGLNAHCTNIQKCAPGVTVKLPNNMAMEATHTALLDMPSLPIAARHCHLFPDMANKALLSIAQFCDNGYRAIFTNTKLIMEHESDPWRSFEGHRDLTNNMWSIDLRNLPRSNSEVQSLATPGTQTMSTTSVSDATLSGTYIELQDLRSHQHGVLP